VENLKRKYQTAIGRLPYGIPSAELKDRDWNELASALATGQKRTLPDGREVTAIGAGGTTRTRRLVDVPQGAWGEAEGGAEEGRACSSPGRGRARGGQGDAAREARGAVHHGEISEQAYESSRRSTNPKRRRRVSIRNRW